MNMNLSKKSAYFSHRKWIQSNRRVLLCGSLILLLAIAAITSFSVVYALQQNTETITVYQYRDRYVIRKGDTLSGIASDFRNHGYKSKSSFFKSICEINLILNPDYIQAGQAIWIPTWTQTCKEGAFIWAQKQVKIRR